MSAARGGSARAPVVVIDSGDHLQVSRGDAAMLKGAIAQLRAFWPAAEIGVVSASPIRLRLLEPSVRALPETAPERWTLNGPSLHPVPPRWALDALWGLTDRWALDHRAHAVLRRIAATPALAPLRRAEPRGAPQLRPDLTLGAGGGYLCDMDAARAIKVLDTLAWGKRLGSVTAMFSQGVGPVTDQALLERMREVLPTLDLICLRERLTGPPILQQLGVSPEKVLVPGDDAILLGARTALPLAQRKSIGVSLRSASYLELQRREQSWLHEVVAEVADGLQTPLRPVTSCEWMDEDRGPNRRAAERAARAEPDIRRSAPPEEFVAAIRGCRIMVTTLYHAAFFALCQGLPAVGVGRSSYQQSKFEGLAELFGGKGLWIVQAADGDAPRRTRQSMFDAWDAAAELTAPLCERAQQIRRDVERGYELLRALHERRTAPDGAGEAAFAAGTAHGS